MDAVKYVSEGAIPLQVHLHESEVTILPPPPPAMILAPRVGYLPLLISLIKPFFSSSLPPGVDSVWFDYKGLPIKWYIPTGVLFDLLCTEPERPWNLTVHFRDYPGSILIPCEGEESVKWSFINSLKEAAYIINGNCKNVMNMSQSDQAGLWKSVTNGNLDSFRHISSKLKLATVEDEYSTKILHSQKSYRTTGEAEMAGQTKIRRIPVRLYVWSTFEDFDDFEDAPQVDNWDKVAYVNHPVEIPSEKGKYFSLHDALRTLLAGYFPDKHLVDREHKSEAEQEQKTSSEDAIDKTNTEEAGANPENPELSHTSKSSMAGIKLVRIHGIEPKLEIPFSWVVNNLMNPEYFLHICVCLKVPQPTYS